MASRQLKIQLSVWLCVGQLETGKFARPECPAEDNLAANLWHCRCGARAPELLCNRPDGRASPSSSSCLLIEDDG